MSDVVLKASGVTVYFGGLCALNGVSLEIRRGQVTSLIGPNGAGKTTLFNVLTGFVVPSKGRVLFKERDITRLPANAISSLGVIRTFQRTRVFPSLSVLENVLLGFYPVRGESPLIAILNRSYWRKEENAHVQKALATLEMVDLASAAEEPASTLAYGQRKLLELAKAIVAEPKILLLDEPFAGIFGVHAQRMVELITSIASNGTAVCLIEHNVDVVMGLSHYIFVLDHGELIARGKPEEVRSDPKVIEAYLGR